MIKKAILIILSLFVLTGAAPLQTEAQESDISVKSGGRTLIKDVDYTLSYRDNIKPGTATVVVTFIGNYAGTAEQTFNIVRKRSGGGSSSGGGNRYIPPVNGDTTETTDKSIEHKAYIVGYDDGAFKPENNMTRAEAAAIFARNIAERKDETISSRKSSFKDVSSKDWFNDYIAYLEKYKVISGYNDGAFKPNEPVTRAEFVTICMRFYELDGKATASEKNIFNDVPKSHWASGYIYSAVGMGWIKGYEDKTFKPDNNITRAEVVTIVNRVIKREADTEYINKNMSDVNKFTDLKDKSYWAYYNVLEASHTHKTIDGESGETWVR